MSTPLANVILRGTRASQPVASGVCAGSLYFVTDEVLTERSDGVNWQSYSGAAASGLVILDSQVVTANTSTITFTGLDGNADLVYIILGRLKNDTGGACRYDWLPNGTASGQAGFRGASTFSSLVLGSLSANGYVSFQATISSQANPNSVATPRTYSGYVSETTIAPTASGGTIGGIWNDTSTNITSIVIQASAVSGIANGSSIALFRLA